LLAVLFGATGYLVSTLTEGYVSRELGMWVISTIVLFYVTRGGFKSIFSVGVVQSWLYFLTVIILGLIIYSFIGDIETFGKSLAKVASTKISFWGNTNGYGGGDYNSYFALPGVIQWVAGLGKNGSVGGPWTAMMIFTFTISFMGIVFFSIIFNVELYSQTSKSFFLLSNMGISRYCWSVIVYICNFSRNWC
jgi:SSS family solute:Na+ symporter